MRATAQKQPQRDRLVNFTIVVIQPCCAAHAARCKRAEARGTLASAFHDAGPDANRSSPACAPDMPAQCRSA